jgi:putative phosphoribosyl transferase
VLVGAVVAQALGCECDVVVVKKIGFPGQKELAVGAMAEDGAVTLNQSLLSWSGLKDDDLEPEKQQVKAKIDDYVNKFRQGRSLDLKSKIVILVDDGVATGETMKAAILWMSSKDRRQRPKQTVVAAPVISASAYQEFTALADKVVSLAVPDRFYAVSFYYWDFDQISDEEVVECLSESRNSMSTTVHQVAGS